MPLTRVYAEGFGPFEKLDLDFSDGSGNPHPGPHILCGVNGCGKSTALRVIAWLLADAQQQYPMEWLHARKRDQTKHFSAMCEWVNEEKVLDSLAVGIDSNPEAIREWMLLKRHPEVGKSQGSFYNLSPRENLGFVVRPPHYTPLSFGCSAAYSPSIVRSLAVTAEKKSSQGAALSFDSTISTAEVLQWWKSVYTRRDLAKVRNLSKHVTQLITERLDEVVKLVTEGTVELDLDIDTDDPKPIGRYHGQKLSFEQMPSGMLAILGVLSDYFRRLAQYIVSKNLETLPHGILLFDEIDTHLHPSWQRRILPALRKALPSNIQIICTTHSPFVINSCRDAKVHVLEVNEDGTSVARQPEAAPFGQSFAATIKDIFGVDTQYDWQTEMDLKRWNELKRMEVADGLRPDEQSELSRLVDELSRRSEELRLIVSPGPSITSDRMQEILSVASQK